MGLTVPAVLTIGAGLLAAFFEVISDGGTQQLSYSLCDAGACGAPRLWGSPRAQVKSPSPLSLFSGSPGRMAAWQENGAVWVGTEDGGASLALSGGAGSDFHPQLVGLDPNTHAWLVVDTSNAGLGDSWRVVMLHSLQKAAADNKDKIKQLLITDAGHDDAKQAADIQDLVSRGVDTVVVTGCTTSGCVRATVVDALSYGFRPIIPEEAVGDRAHLELRARA